MPRDNALDFVKGAAVVAMAAHHSINYFSSPYISTKYVHFVSGAFPFLAGFLVTHILAKRNQTPATSRASGMRLVFRGGRLLLLCGLLNVLLALILGNVAKFGRLSESGYFSYLSVLYWSGNYRQVSFSLLVPIGYILITLGLLQIGRILRRELLVIIALLLFIYCSFSGFAFAATTYYTDYFTIGMLGAALGWLPGELLLQFCQQKFVVIGVYLASLAAIIFLGQPFPLFAASVTATLLLLYMLGAMVRPNVWYIRSIAILGRYSLFMYVVQIAILFIFRVFLYYFLPEFANALLGFVFVCVSQLAICFGLDKLRTRSRTVDRLYVAVFA